MVVGTSNFSNTEAIEKLEYYEVTDGNWYPLQGDFGPSDGFPMSDVTSRFRVTFSKAGDNSFTASMKPAAGGDALCSTEVSFTVSKNELELTADRTEMKGKGNVILTLNGLLGEDTATVSCDDGSISLTENSDGTYSVYLPNRTQTYTFTATAANTDKYATDDVVVSVRKKSSSSSDSSSGTSTVKPEEKPAEKPTEQPEEKPIEKPDEKPTTPTNPAEVPAAEKIVLTVGQRVTNAFGSPVVNDVAPIIREDRTMLPIRFIAEGLSATVAWDDALNKVSITKGDDVIDIYIGSVVAFVNGSPVELDSPAFIENSRTYLPLRFVAENLGAEVFWNAETQEVTIVPINEA